MEDSGTDAGHTDESDLLDAQMTSGIPLIGAGRARLILHAVLAFALRKREIYSCL